MWRNKKASLGGITSFLMVWRKRTLCEEEKLRNEKVISDLERATIYEEMNWRQKSRALWL